MWLGFESLSWYQQLMGVFCGRPCQLQQPAGEHCFNTLFLLHGSGAEHTTLAVRLLKATHVCTQCSVIDVRDYLIHRAQKQASLLSFFLAAECGTHMRLHERACDWAIAAGSP